MFGKLKAAFAVLRQGQIVADPATWKNRDMAITGMAALFASLYAMARAFGYELPFDRTDIDALAAGIAAVVWMYHGWSTVATSTKVGLPDKRTPDPEGGSSDKSVTEWDAEYRQPGIEP